MTETKPAAPSPTPLRVVRLVGLEKVPAGWCVVYAEVEGDRVLSTEILSGPEPRMHAENKFRVEAAKRILYPGLS